MPVNKSQRFSIRLLLDREWISSLNDISRAHMISRLALLRRYIHQNMIADLEAMREDFERLKRIESTKKDLNQKLKHHQGIKMTSINEPIDY